MKKIAFFVEGQTEQFFLNKLLIEIAGANNVRVLLKKFKGKGKPTEDIMPKSFSQGAPQVRHTVLIYDCAGDESVKTRILEEAQNLFDNGYTQIIGLRDLYPLPDYSKLMNRLAHGLVVGGKRIEEALPANTSILIAIREIEDWFLAECRHYTCIDPSLVLDATQIASLGFNPHTDNLTLRTTSAAEDIKTVYRLAGKTYSKAKNKVERTVECLDYANLYMEIRQKIPKLNELIVRIDNFLA